MSHTVALAVRATLEGSAQTKGRGRANVLAAARKAGGSEADRRLLHGLAYQWGRGRQIQERVFNRVLTLLARLTPSRARALRELFWTRDGERALRNVLMESAWAELATPVEVALMTRQPGAELPPEIHAPVRNRVPLLRKNARVARELDAFQEWARDHGHSRWVIGPSLRRALGPLVSHTRTRGVLPGWDELRPADQYRFIQLSLAREKMLLGTQPLHLRAMQRFQSPKAVRLKAESDTRDSVAAIKPLSVTVRCPSCAQRYRATQQQRVCPYCGSSA
jgi:hypothetical protein